MLWKVNLLKFRLTAFHKLSINLTLILKSIKSSVGVKVNDVYIIAPSKCNFECHLPIISGGLVPWVATPGFCYALNTVVRVVAKIWLGFYRSSCDDLGWLSPSTLSSEGLRKSKQVTTTHGQTSGQGRVKSSRRDCLGHSHLFRTWEAASTFRTLGGYQHLKALGLCPADGSFWLGKPSDG